MSPTRRDFVKHSAMLGAAGLAGIAPRLAYGAPRVDGKQSPTLVVVYLRGGADPLNAIVPYGDPLYYAARPTISVPMQQAGRNAPVLRLNDYFGFNPAMKELAELYKQGMMAPIMNAGSTHPTRSHFDAQDFMERAAPGIKSVTEGWLNRYLTMTQGKGDDDLRAVSLQSTLPRSLRGEYSVLATPDYGADHAMDVFERLYDCDSNEEAKRKNAPATQPSKSKKSANAAEPDEKLLPEEATRQRILTAGDDSIRKLRELNKLTGGRDPSGYPRSRLGEQFRDVAKLIKSNRGLEIAAFDYNGWDHHAYQGGSTGTMADMLSNLSQSISAFVGDLGKRMDRTLVLTMSEFGRTVRENGNAGTDHGRAGYMLAVGGMVQGHKFYGGWSGLERKQLVAERDLPVHTDFRRVFAETLACLFKFDADKHDFFPGYETRTRPLGFLKPVVMS